MKVFGQLRLPIAIGLIWIVVSSLPSAAAPPPKRAQERVAPARASEAETPEARLLFFSADWCAPCREVTPVLSKLAERFPDELEFVTIDFDQAPVQVEKFEIEELPTLLLFDSTGKLVIRVEGASKKGLDALLAELQSLLESSPKHPSANNPGGGEPWNWGSLED